MRARLGLSTWVGERDGSVRVQAPVDESCLLGLGLTPLLSHLCRAKAQVSAREGGSAEGEGGGECGGESEGEGKGGGEV